MDSIEIRELSCRCIVGILARERRVPQQVRLNLDLSLDLERAGKSGRIAHTIDYSRATSELIALLQYRRYLLLEVAAEECVGWLFAAHPALKAASLTMLKPQALAGQAECGGVRISRQRPSDGPRVTTDFGFLQTQLETSEACISLLGLGAGQSFDARALGASSALLLPLSSKLEIKRPLLAHDPVQLSGEQRCSNRDSVSAHLVVCAQR